MAKFYLGILLTFFGCFEGVAQRFTPTVQVLRTGGTTISYELPAGSINGRYKTLTVITEKGEQDFTPNDIDGFILENGKKYLSLPNRNSGEKSFYQIPIEGEVSLGYLDSHFYLIIDGTAVPLTLDSRSTGGNELRKNLRKTYLGVLHVGLGGCNPALDEQINETNLSYPSLEKLMISYFECKGLSYQLHGKEEKFVKVGMSVSGGVDRINSKLGGKMLTTAPLGWRAEVLASVEMEKFSPRIRAEFGLAYLEFEDRWRHGPPLSPGGERFFYEEVFKMSLIQIPAMFNYKLINLPAQEFYFGVGPKFNWVKKTTLSEISQYEFMQESPPHSISTRDRDPLYMVTNSRVGFMGKIGYAVKGKKLSPFLEIQYEVVSKLGFLTFFSREVYEYNFTSIGAKLGLRF